MSSHGLWTYAASSNYQVSKLACFADDEEEEISENETPKVKKKKKAKKSKESKGSKRRSRREVRLSFFFCFQNEQDCSMNPYNSVLNPMPNPRGVEPR